ncbi:hypothetical protein [Dactylosporangium sp. NPDC048998]|uniref:hypothetical protein n=1 Tax=Dactylosporangium sp. NPDC048998 TaxID=3363976 RepID=UPI003716D74D
MADPDLEAADEGRDGFYSSIWHQGSVYPVTVVAVPFLVELDIPRRAGHSVARSRVRCGG